MNVKLIMTERKSYIMKDNSKNNTSYVEARSRWTREQAEPFLNSLKKIGEETGLDISPMQYVTAYRLCIEEYKFGYPAEHKLTELISTGETYERVLALMAEVMKRFRLMFHKERKKQIEQMNERTSRKRVA